MSGKVRNQLFLNEYVTLSSQREIIFTHIVQMVELLLQKRTKNKYYLIDYFKEINLHLHYMEVSSFLKKLI